MHSFRRLRLGGLLRSRTRSREGAPADALGARMNPPGNSPPPGPQPPYGAPQPGQPPYGAPQPGQQPYGAPVTQPTYPQAPGYPAPQPNYPMQPYGAPQQPQYGYPPQQPYGMPAPQPMIIVQNQVNPYGYAMAHPNPIKKDTALLLTIIGFFILPGLQRFYMRQAGMGVLYVLTGGLCVIGQIVDVIQLLSMSQQEFDMKYNMMR
jgi:TM2 domain-containing membrane protein YozV